MVQAPTSVRSNISLKFAPPLPSPLCHADFIRFAAFCSNTPIVATAPLPSLPPATAMADTAVLMWVSVLGGGEVYLCMREGGGEADDGYLCTHIDH